jgi:hypothetical protein
MPSELTGAVALPGDECLLLADAGYYVLDARTGVLGDGPLSIAGRFGGLWSMGRTVPVYWGCGKLFFLNGPEFLRFDLATGRADHPEPGIVAHGWPGLWPSGVDAAFNAGNGKIYFFKGSQYIRYDIVRGRADDWYPRSIAEDWPGVWPDGIDAALCADGLTVVFFRGTEHVVYDLLSEAVTAGPLPNDGLRLDPLPSGMMKPARDLSPEQANAIVAHLAQRGQLSLEATQNPLRMTDGGRVLSPRPDQRVALSPVVLAGVRYAAKADRAADIIDNVDQRMAVALWRLARWADASGPDVEVITHLGTGRGGPEPDDCHNLGRAIDIAGIEGSLDGRAFALDVLRDWGSRPTSDPSTYRLSEDDEPAFELFKRIYAFGTFECECRGIGKDPWPPPEIGEGGYVICPDHHGAGTPDELRLRRDHADHVHMQLGPTRGAW